MATAVPDLEDAADAAGREAQLQDYEAEESEWEYEYDQDETEDLYFTLDLTTHVPNALEAKAKEHPQSGKAKLKKATAAGHAARDKRNSVILSTVEPIKDGDDDEGSAQPEAGKLQVLDLHTSNPYVKFNDDVYSCYWMTDLGTQFYVSSPGVTEKPLRPGNVVDVVGISQVRLLGKPVTLKPRKETGEKEREGATSTNTINVGDDSDSDYEPTRAESDFATLRPGQPLVIPRDRVKNQVMEAQASFLERLSAIKLKKGENDIIPVSGVRYYEPPPNKDEIREKAFATEAERQQNQEDARQVEQAAKRRKRPTYAELGKETKAEQAKRLKQMPERQPLPELRPAPPTLLLPRSQSSINATTSPWSVPTVMGAPFATVTYDAPGWGAEPIGSSSTSPGLSQSYAFSQQLGPVRSRATATERSATPPRWVYTASSSHERSGMDSAPANGASTRTSTNGQDG